ncbi:MAG: hypothetical protein L7F78_11960 [Syntrophales bacterium LBB04]|nr:hypothetical protein [Syntrophales bacterium LBB04]
MKYPVDMARISRVVVPKYPPYYPAGRTTDGYLSDGLRPASLAEEAKRFGVEILVCGVEPGASWNRQEGLGLSGVQCFFSTGRSKTDPLGKDRQLGGLVKKWANF